MPIPPASQNGLFCRDFPYVRSIEYLADISCVLENKIGEAARSTQSVILYITIKITPTNLYNSPPSVPIEDNHYPHEGPTVPGRIEFPVPEHLLPPAHHKAVEIGKTIPQGQEEMSPTSTNNPRFALHRADESMKRIVPIDQSNTWERALGRIKWVMDTLGPIAEVRVMTL